MPSPLQIPPKLLAPAGTLTRLKTALLYGADAIYAGFPSLTLRATGGFTPDEMIAASQLVRSADKQLYLALNAFSRNSDIPRLQKKILPLLREINPHALIVSDPGIFTFLRENAPHIPLHVSTQANVSSWLTVQFWEKLGAQLCVLARETTFADFLEIREKCPAIALEIFIHGSMCMAYSGRCLISSNLTGRSANRGLCTNSCRWNYKLYLEEEQRPGTFIPLEQDDRGTYILNSRDLCLLPKLPQILSSGVNSLKIEGRNKSEYYVAQTTRIYRAAIDDFYSNPDTWSPAPYMTELETLQHRGYTQGAFDAPMDHNAQNPDTALSQGTAQNVGLITGTSTAGLLMELRAKVSQNDTIDILLPKQLAPLRITLKTLLHPETKLPIPSISPGAPHQQILLPPENFPHNTIPQIPPLTQVRRLA